MARGGRLRRKLALTRPLLPRELLTVPQMHFMLVPLVLLRALYT